MNHRTSREIIVRFSSGLGNQLFQLACGLATASATGAPLRADTTWYTLVARMHRPVRRFRLPLFEVPTTEAFAGSRRLAVGFTAAVFDRWKRGRGLCEFLGQMRIEQEHRTMTEQKIAGRPGRTYLNGYWQTSHHFLAARDELLPMLQPKAPLSRGASLWLEKIRSKPTAFLHVRRGDYETLAGDEGLLPLSYYKRATEAVSSRSLQDLQWAVFAEDEAWAGSQLGFLRDCEIVKYDSPDRDVEDMHLMAQCNAGVIANSSYSWWAAAIGEKAGRPIAAPDRYWRSGGEDTAAWRLPSWLSVKAW